MRNRLIVLGVIAVGAGFPAGALAYLDPGTESILVQGLIAAVAGTAAAVGLYWQRIKSFFSARSRRRNEPPARRDDEQARHGR